MNLEEALEVISGNGSKLLIPVKMGFFIMIRPVEPGSFTKPSVPSELREGNDWLPSCDFECRLVEVTSEGWRPLEKLQGKWVQWGVEPNDINRDTFMVV
ncbi:hypothetical protein [Marinobacter algicola]|uniref:Uncharacterized protein n=1 Tax=Marinobacter algicola DG893 TaxID=443152 RepID=A6F0L6_9GAMM|nr:hypothetical protein [Marinobacter algicola]EDM47777.1 hypothetical protein MDG893_20694 [Marinobacter algicola DG893]